MSFSKFSNEKGSINNPILIDIDPPTVPLEIALGPVKIDIAPTELTFVSVGPNRTRILTAHPYPTCKLCPDVISFYNHTIQLLDQTKIDHQQRSCIHSRHSRCLKLKEKFLKKAYRHAEADLIYFLELHFRSHMKCGNLTEVPHG